MSGPSDYLMLGRGQTRCGDGIEPDHLMLGRRQSGYGKDGTLSTGHIHPLLITEPMRVLGPPGVQQKRTHAKGQWHEVLWRPTSGSGHARVSFSPFPLRAPVFFHIGHLTFKSDMGGQSHRFYTCQRPHEGPALPWGLDRVEHHSEWLVDTVGTHISVNKLTISTPGAYFPVNMQKCWGGAT